MSSRSKRARKSRAGCSRAGEIEQLVLLVVHDGDLARERDLDGALAALLERVGVGLELVAAGVAAGERAALDSPCAG
jgi:hypothetical protein